jgi:hypothetical protein
MARGGSMVGSAGGGFGGSPSFTGLSAAAEGRAHTPSFSIAPQFLPPGMTLEQAQQFDPFGQFGGIGGGIAPLPPHLQDVTGGGGPGYVDTVTGLPRTDTTVRPTGYRPGLFVDTSTATGARPTGGRQPRTSIPSPTRNEPYSGSPPSQPTYGPGGPVPIQRNIRQFGSPTGGVPWVEPSYNTVDFRVSGEPRGGPQQPAGGTHQWGGQRNPYGGWRNNPNNPNFGQPRPGNISNPNVAANPQQNGYWTGEPTGQQTAQPQQPKPKQVGGRPVT